MLGEVILFMLVLYELNQVMNLMSKKNRQAIKDKNLELNKLRAKRFKTIDEQKVIADAVRPKWDIKFDMNFVMSIIYGTVKYTILFMFYMYVLGVLNLQVSVSIAILCWLIVPITFSYILTKLKLESDNLFHILKW
jgi:hypothetical protein